MLKGNLRRINFTNSNVFAKANVESKSRWVFRTFRYGNLVRRSGLKWIEARQATKRASEPIKDFTKAWEREQLTDYGSMVLSATTHRRRNSIGVEHAMEPINLTSDFYAKIDQFMLKCRERFLLLGYIKKIKGKFSN
ncbi:unnamed protein product [Colias eurytheme]|nr:unnamed protein product [Colias eurytheme]